MCSIKSVCFGHCYTHLCVILSVDTFKAKLVIYTINPLDIIKYVILSVDTFMTDMSQWHNYSFGHDYSVRVGCIEINQFFLNRISIFFYNTTPRRFNPNTPYLDSKLQVTWCLHNIATLGNRKCKYAQ
jgi:hypothetical protein